MLVICIIQFPKKEKTDPHHHIGLNIIKDSKKQLLLVGRRAEKSCYNTHFRDIKIRSS